MQTSYPQAVATPQTAHGHAHTHMQPNGYVYPSQPFAHTVSAGISGPFQPQYQQQPQPPPQPHAVEPIVLDFDPPPAEVQGAIDSIVVYLAQYPSTEADLFGRKDDHGAPLYAFMHDGTPHHEYYLWRRYYHGQGRDAREMDARIAQYKHEKATRAAYAHAPLAPPPAAPIPVGPDALHPAGAVTVGPVPSGHEVLHRLSSVESIDQMGRVPMPVHGYAPAPVAPLPVAPVLPPDVLHLPPAYVVQLAMHANAAAAASSGRANTKYTPIDPAHVPSEMPPVGNDQRSSSLRDKIVSAALATRG